MSHIVIIGGSDAGVSAALRIKELNQEAEVSVIVGDSYPGFSICGLPFLLSGEVTDWHTLAHHSAAEFEQQGIRSLLNQRAEAIDPQKKTVRIVSNEQQAQEIGYDKLLVATGAESARLPISGLDQPDVFFLRWMMDGFAMQESVDSKNPQKAVIIGGGYIGISVLRWLTL
jgi:NADPH-dependent 2,4-dienoyl-CoA reductase/sulfur reductase-like enzyme